MDDNEKLDAVGSLEAAIYVLTAMDKYLTPAMLMTMRELREIRPIREHGKRAAMMAMLRVHFINSHNARLVVYERLFGESDFSNLTVAQVDALIDLNFFAPRLVEMAMEQIRATIPESNAEAAESAKVEDF